MSDAFAITHITLKINRGIFHQIITVDVKCMYYIKIKLILKSCLHVLESGLIITEGHWPSLMAFSASTSGLGALESTAIL